MISLCPTSPETTTQPTKINTSSQSVDRGLEMPKSLAISAIEASPLRATATTSSRNSFGWGLGTINILPAVPPGTTDQMSPTRAAVPLFVEHPAGP